MANPYLLPSADANRARGKIPTGQEAEKAGEEVGKEGVSNIDEAVFLPPLFPVPPPYLMPPGIWYTMSTVC